MRGISIKEKIKILLGDQKMIIGIVILLAGILFYKAVSNPLSYKPIFSSIMSETDSVKVTNVQRAEKNGFYEVTYIYSNPEKTKDGVEIENTKSNSVFTKNLKEMPTYIDIKYSKINKNWASVQGDSWNAAILIPWAVIIFSLMYLYEPTKIKIREIKMFVYGQITDANLISKEKEDKKIELLEYMFVDESGEKHYIMKRKKIGASGDKKIMSVLYNVEDPKENILIESDYGIDLYRL